jgi:hypothetical protein
MAVIPTANENQLLASPMPRARQLLAVLPVFLPPSLLTGTPTHHQGVTVARVVASSLAMWSGSSSFCSDRYLTSDGGVIHTWVMQCRR